jgi:hypothetical protein
MNARMRQAAARLNLKGHMAGVNRAKSRQFLYGPADIEGHRSWQDNRYYVLDFARGECCVVCRVCRVVCRVASCVSCVSCAH